MTHEFIQAASLAKYSTGVIFIFEYMVQDFVISSLKLLLLKENLLAVTS